MMTKQFSVLLLGLATTAGCVGEEGEDGEMGAPGEMGEMGEKGETGETGAAGTACWDLNMNSACDVESEDKNASGTCDVNDCAANGEGYILNAHATGAKAQENAYFNLYSHSTSKIVNNGTNGPVLVLQGLAAWDAVGSGTMPLLQLRSGSPVRTYAWIDNYGGFVSSGRIGYGSIPMEGQGERMMWAPHKAAFRVGGVGLAGTQWNDANLGLYSFAAGFQPKASGYVSVAMGEMTTATGTASVAMGANTIAGGAASFAMGASSTAAGTYSVALGRQANASTSGSFVFADSTNASVSPLAANQFIVRASGGIRLYTNGSATSGVYLNAGGSGWDVVSDRNAKTNFLPIDGEDLLARLANVEVSNWVYKDEAGQPRHIGPMAQDFYAAFGLGTGDTRINSLDIDGVNMAAVQALELRTRELAHTTRKVAELEAEVKSLRADIERLEKLVIAQQRGVDAVR